MTTALAPHADLRWKGLAAERPKVSWPVPGRASAVLYLGDGPAQRAREPNERGAGTLMVAGVLVVLVSVTLMSFWAIGWLASAQSARSVADLAAVAGAQELVSGGDACASARRVADANGGQVVRCEVRTAGVDFRVIVKVQVPLLPRVLGQPAWISGSAVSGPVLLVEA